MKIFFCNIIAIAFMYIFTQDVFAAEVFNIDPNHSYVLWHINHFGFSEQSGKWMVAEGTLNLDKAKLQKSKVNITIRVANIITGVSDLDKHLKGNLFFDVTQFPFAKFVSDKITLIDKDTALVYGILTVRGISKPISLDVKLNKIGVNPITNKETVGFKAITTLKRSEFGINTLSPGLGDEVKIDIQLEAFKS